MGNIMEDDMGNMIRNMGKKWEKLMDLVNLMALGP
jgi:hypothetical protein